MTTANNDDRELEQYLTGKDGLSRQYKSVAADVPPSHIDEAILAASRKAVGARPGRFMPPYFGRLDAPLAIAAVVVLSVLVMFNLPDENLTMGTLTEADLNAGGITTSAATTRLESVSIDLAEGRLAEREDSSNANLAEQSARMKALSIAPVPASEALRAGNGAIEPVQPPVSITAADTAETMMQMQKAMTAESTEATLNSEVARLMQPLADVVMDEPAQRDSYAGGASADPAGPQFTECTTPRPEVCTMQYLPVCATRNTGIRCVTTPCDSSEQLEFSNACSACADPDVIGYAAGACPVAE